jgi:hypothetical protein
MTKRPVGGSSGSWSPSLVQEGPECPAPS